MSVAQPRTTEECVFIYDVRYLYEKGIVLSSRLVRILHAISALKRGTADDIAKYLGQSRGEVARRLSKLSKFGIVAKVREGLRVYYVEPVTAVKEALEKYGDNILIEQLAHILEMRADIVHDIVRCLERRGEPV